MIKVFFLKKKKNSPINFSLRQIKTATSCMKMGPFNIIFFPEVLASSGRPCALEVQKPLIKYYCH